MAGRLKTYRISNDLSFEALSEKTGIPASTLYRIENAIVEPNERTVHKLTEAVPSLKEGGRK